MGWNVASLLLLCSASLCSGLQVGIYEAPVQQVTTGSSLSLTCHLNRGLAVILYYTIEWVHVPLADLDQVTETVLTRQQALQDGAPPNVYSINVTHTPYTCNFTLTILQVAEAHDGQYYCRASTMDDQLDDVVQSVEVVVLSDVQSMQLTLDGEPAVTEVSQVAVERKEGRYDVTCAASGFSPGATVALYIGQERLETSDPRLTPDLPTSRRRLARRYTASVTADRVTFRPEHTSQKLRCEATADFDGAEPAVVSVPLVIVALEPEIRCEQNASARPGERYVKISCFVYHPDIDIKSYSWEVGDTGYIIIPNVPNDNYDEVIIQPGENHTTQVTLDLFEVGEANFNTYYYLDVFTRSGQKFRETATLIREDPLPTDSSTAAAVSVLGFVLSVVFSLFSLWR